MFRSGMMMPSWHDPGRKNHSGRFTSDKSNPLCGKIPFDIVASVDDIPPQAGKILDNDTVDKARFNIGEHLLEAGPVKIRTRCTVVNVGLNHDDFRVLLRYRAIISCWVSIEAVRVCLSSTESRT